MIPRRSVDAHFSASHADGGRAGKRVGVSEIIAYRCVSTHLYGGVHHVYMCHSTESVPFPSSEHYMQSVYYFIIQPCPLCPQSTLQINNLKLPVSTGTT